MVASRFITGGAMILIGLGLILVPLFVSFTVNFITLFYGIPILVLGVIILFNKKEDTVEQINKTGGKK